MLTPVSFRIRLARATYVDAVTGKALTTRWAIFIEDQDDVNEVWANFDIPEETLRSLAG